MSDTVEMQSKAQKVKTKVTYKKYSDEDMIECLRAFCLSTNETIAKDVTSKHLEEKKVSVPLPTFYKIFAKEVEVGHALKSSLLKLRTDFQSCYPAKHLVDKQSDQYKKLANSAESIIQALYKKKKENMAVQRETVKERNRALSHDEELYLAQLCKVLAASGHGLEDADILHCMNIISPPHKNKSYSRHAARNFRNRHLKLKGSSNIDQKRAEQANDYVRETFFCKLNAYVEILYAMGRSKWKSFAEIPPKFKYNMDEVASDTTKRRKKIAADIDEQQRLFTITKEGDKMAFHVTCCLTTRADGQYISPEEGIVDGAPPPVIIHKKASEKDPTEVPSSAMEGLKIAKRKSPGLDCQDHNYYGFLVLATPNGSMKQSTMLPYAEHFIKFLPDDRAPDDPIILLLDGHSSRWDIPALKYLFENRVYAFYLPSHTSVWSQPNDCGPNKRLHECIARASREHRMQSVGTSEKYGPSNWNEIFCSAWSDFLGMERNDFKFIQSNTATFAYLKTGLEPFNPNPISWKEAIESLGISSREQNSRRMKSFEIVPNNSGTKILTDEEKKNLLSGSSEFDIDANESQKILVAATRHAKSILARWRTAYEEKCDELEKASWQIDNKNKSCSKSPENLRQVFDLLAEIDGMHPNSFALANVDDSCLNVVKFVLVDSTMLPTLPSMTAEEKRKHYVEVLLEQTKILGNLTVRKRLFDSSGKCTKTLPGNATKLSVSTWSCAFTDDSQPNNALATETVTSESLIAGNIFYVATEDTDENISETESLRRYGLIKRRKRAEDQMRREKAENLGKKAREQMIRDEYSNLLQIMDSKRHYEFQEFSEMMKRLTSPHMQEFIIDGETYQVITSEKESGVLRMMVHNEIIQKLFGNKRKCTADDVDSESCPKKRQHTIGNGLGRRQVPTHLSENALMAYEALKTFDARKNKKELEKKVKALTKEKKSVSSLYNDVLKFKTQHPNTYWNIPDGSTKSHVQLFFRLFNGTSYSSKSTETMLSYLNGTGVVVCQTTFDHMMTSLEIKVKGIEKELEQYNCALTEIINDDHHEENIVTESNTNESPANSVDS